MSSTLRVFSNYEKGSGDYIEVYCDGEVLFRGEKVPNSPSWLFDLLKMVNGWPEYIKYYEITDEQVKKRLEDELDYD